MSLLLSPKFLILDEPTSALDVLTQKYFLKLMRDIQKKMGMTMLFITHDLGTVAEIADRVAIMYLANIVEVGNVEDIFYDPKHPYTDALIKSIPSISGAIGDVEPIPGPVPDPVSPPSGCRFHPRCPFAFDKCTKEEPKLKDIEGESKNEEKITRCRRLVACFLYDSESDSN